MAGLSLAFGVSWLTIMDRLGGLTWVGIGWLRSRLASARDVAEVVRRQKAAPAILAGHAFGHFVAKMTAVDYPQLVRAVILIGAAQKNPDPAVQRAVAIASDPTQPEAERLKNLKLVFFAPGNDPTTWLSGFHANVRAAEIVARDATPQAEYYAAGKVPMVDIQGDNDP